ncbi:solute carrier family 2, facilitated glucose transporter member 5 isoform X2 [Microcaecilia unicolor]|uniref:Solute carrier family 2, facilitated glucose transporter member 5-like isoform X2 n=1 Tax=Microcaecilia unicolor TaxID=1415580 RepID=A0A6P7XTE6_9AMPH|nr:solute carrier family 2, facilitated glucose transporter member 5-like isoform X2 [Microcaecilia unicolor]
MDEKETLLSNRKLAGHLTFPLLAAGFLSSFGSSMLYGYNLAVVNSPAEHIKAFYNATWFYRYGQPLTLSPLILIYSLTVSIFACGGLLGSLIVGKLVSGYGRKGTIVRSAPLVFIAGGIMGLSRVLQSPEMVVIGRLISGLHSGISLSAVPMFLGEIAPKNLRGFLGLMPSIFICLGVFAAQILGLPELLGKDEYWPLFLSLIVVPTFLQFLLLPWFPESPRYLLIEKDNPHASIHALKSYHGDCDVHDLIQEMKDEKNSLSSVEMCSVQELLSDHSLRWQVITIVVINIGMQMSGIDAIWFYTNAIFANAGVSPSQIPYTTVGTGAIEIIAGLLGCFTIEKLGRRPLLISGFVIMGICCAGITVALELQERVRWMNYVTVACVIGIIAGFCIGPAGVPFILTAELFKQSHRPAAYILGGAFNWICNFIVGLIFPFFQISAGAFAYLVFCVICLLVAGYVFLIVPETKNKTFLEISLMFASRKPHVRFSSADGMKMGRFSEYE